MVADLHAGLPLFVEKFLPGIEITVGILDNKALPVIEIVPAGGEWFDFESKYSDQTQEIPDAPSLTPKIRKVAQKIALLIHQKLQLGPYSRIDFIVSNNVPFILEVNTIPGLTPHSSFPKAAQAARMTFEQLVEKLVQLSLKY